jgi:hypothetical protein
VLKKRAEIGNRPRLKRVTDDGLGVQADERRRRRVVPGRSGCEERAAEQSPAGSRRR